MLCPGLSSPPTLSLCSLLRSLDMARHPHHNPIVSVVFHILLFLGGRATKRLAGRVASATPSPAESSKMLFTPQRKQRKRPVDPFILPANPWYLFNCLVSRSGFFICLLLFCSAQITMIANHRRTSRLRNTQRKHHPSKHKTTITKTLRC